MQTTRVLELLVHKFGAHCTKCSAPVMSVRDALKGGHKAEERRGMIKLRNGRSVRVATIQHILPVAFGGCNCQANLTLYCWQCNQQDSKDIDDAIQLGRKGQVDIHGLRNAVCPKHKEGRSKAIPRERDNPAPVRRIPDRR
jgi:hypothetical protein